MHMLLTRSTSALAVAVLAMAVGFETPAASAPSVPKTYHLGYFLPKTRAAVSVAQRLTACPTDRNGPQFETTVTIASRTLPDPDGYITIDAKKGLAAKRSTELKLNADGTLAAFNASNEGQGGVIVNALLKTGLSLATGGIVPMGLAAPSGCKPEIAALLAERARQRAELDDLLGRISAGTAAPAAATALTVLQTALARIDNELTVTSAIAVQPGTLPAYIKVPGIETFFDGDYYSSYLKNHPGGAGFGVSVQPEVAIETRMRTGVTMPKAPTTWLYYRRPVPAQITVYPCLAGQDAKTCTAPAAGETRGDASLHATARVSFAQLSGLHVIPIGRGGLFGSEEASAEFGADGAPTRLKYGGDSGAAALAGVLDTARAGYAAAEKAPAAAQQAQLEELRRRKEIRALEAELSKPIP